MLHLDFNSIVPLQTITISKPIDNVLLNVLRLDKLHSIVSGNKWFKLQYYLQDAIKNNINTIATFGGAYSNHIAATAFVCKEYNLKGIGIIRGDENQTSPTIKFAQECNMELLFINRENFKDKNAVKEKYKTNNWYWINEGGYGIMGCKGAASIMKFIPEDATHIIAAVGTGTTFAGLIKAALPHQKVIGINILKGNLSIHNEIKNLLTEEEQQKKFEIIHHYHFGGYAKHPKELIEFMKQLWFENNLPTDIVYTSKMMFAVIDLITKKYFKPNSKIVAIHSGGLQGNFSLPPNTLPF
ncbi:MAG: pyridoxal-phosphate dependent enzyme [Bacteroidetes bacterium]|nr:pyridoxal-phosphate dependent enzyme [Bacteroidota bacterium]MBS1648100.1 pyridoxal-phosphate dependent enzyme [Bacteroidota bacterium]